MFFPVNFAKFLITLNFVTYQGLTLNPQTYNTRSLETTAIAKNLGTCHKCKFIRRTMLRYQRISVAFFSFKNALNDKLLVAGCTRFSRLWANARPCSGIVSFCNSQQLCNANRRYKTLGRAFILISIARCEHLKRAFNGRNQFLIVIAH